MRKLSAIDASFLYTETEHMPNSIAALQILELPDGMDADQFLEYLSQHYMDRIHLLPYLYSKVRTTPGNFDHPVWVTDKNFDISNHIRVETVPPPGDMSCLEARVAELHAELLDRGRPLWLLVIFKGLENPRQIAYYSAAHHACLDGMAGTAATEILMDDTPDPAPVESPEVFPPQDDDSSAELWRMSIQNLMRTQLSIPLAMFSMAESLEHLAERILDPRKFMGAYGRTAPRTRFNHAIEKERSYAVCDFSLDDIKSMKAAAGCTLNDVILAICAGGLRSYLQRHDDLPEKPLIAAVPVSLRAPDSHEMNNQVTMMSVSLATDIDDPWTRLCGIRDSELTGKEVMADIVTGFDNDFAMPGLPAVVIQSARLFDRLHLAEAAPVAMNVVISNVPGPRHCLYSAGAKLLANYPVSIPAHGLGVNITVGSYVDTFYLGITACARALPDAGELRDDILEAFRALRELLHEKQN